MAYHVFFRVDANNLIGTGHFFRCLFIARELKKRCITSTFLMAGHREHIQEIFRKEGFGLEVIPYEWEFDRSYLAGRLTALKKGKSLLVIDHPAHSFYDPTFQTNIRSKNIRLMMITFRSENHFHADIVHNQNLSALEEKYSAESYTKLLLGPEYVILDERYSRLRLLRRSYLWPVQTVLLSFGGVDNTNLTLQALAAMAKMGEKPRRIITVVGPLYARLDELKKFVTGHTAQPVDLHINTRKMPDLMAEADLAITSGGLTIWELACLGIPNLVISISEREKIHTPLLAKRGVCIYLGHGDEVSQNTISEALTKTMNDEGQCAVMASSGMELVDGKGTERVLDQMMDVLHS